MANWTKFTEEEMMLQGFIFYIFSPKKKPSILRVLKVPGNDLLSHAGFPRSTIGATGLNFRVRDGIGCNTCAIVAEEKFRELMRIFKWSKKIDKAIRLISTTQLNILLHLHLWPINVVVYNESYYQMIGRTNLRSGFALICFQRLSFPNIATQRCFWWNNWYTRGSSTSVLSY